jgi:hypothetical protein
LKPKSFFLIEKKAKGCFFVSRQNGGKKSEMFIFSKLALGCW